MVMFLIFLFTDLFIAGIFYAVYGKKRTYTEGMLLGVHLPASAAESGEVVSFMERYHRKTKAFFLMNTLAGALICGFLYMRFKKEKMLAGNRHPLYIDDDVYWKNGWYSNPNDRRLIVQDWVCSWNYTTNMARPLGKFCLLLGVGVTAAVMIWGCREMWKMDFAPIRMEITGEGLEITSGAADYSIRYDEIESVRLLESLPEEDYAGYRLIKGSDSAGKLAGRFRGKETGACRLYIYKGYEPVLEIDTKEGPVYVNSRNEGEAEKWNEKLKKM